MDKPSNLLPTTQNSIRVPCALKIKLSIQASNCPRQKLGQNQQTVMFLNLPIQIESMLGHTTLKLPIQDFFV
jgi:hypothetical protein